MYNDSGAVYILRAKQRFEILVGKETELSTVEIAAKAEMILHHRVWVNRSLFTESVGPLLYKKKPLASEIRSLCFPNPETWLASFWWV